MNPGVFSFMWLLVIAILFATGWGARYTKENPFKVTPVIALLLAIGFLSTMEVELENISFNLASLLIAVAMGIYMGTVKKTGGKIHFLSAAITAGACCFVFMTMVPHDPAFYLLDESYLYPLVSVVTVYLFSREPLFCLTASSAGMLLAGLVHENRLSGATGVIHFGSSELMDLITTVVLISFLFDQFVWATGYLLTKLNRGQEGNLEGDPT
ncbi:hypothetical protein [Effusibacillus consociatus]|uniref:DUF1614 domain-containing protein n=1 Tax=Effusibacillus consociatus TaxID=1117041 RepID=A0ABV9Q8C1_9BACL